MKTEISTHEQQALDFLTKTGTKFTTEFLRHGKMNWDKDNNVTRDIYKVTLKRDKRSYTTEFGQSIANSGEWIVKDKNNRLTKTFHIKADAISYAAKIGNSYNVKKNPAKKAPTAYDLLACLTKYDPGTFEDFCSEFGYDTDSRSAENTYNAVKEEWKNVQSLFTDAEIEELQEIQ